jgi:hypothetical protein
MKHIKEFEEFINESANRTSNKYETQNAEWDDIEPGDFIADGPNVGEVSKVISNTKKGFTLKRVWNNIRKKDGEEFFVPHDLEAMKDYPNSIIKVVNYVDESEVNEILAAASTDKLTNHELLTPKVNATLISNARNGVLKMMKEPDGKTHFWNPKTKEYVAKTITYNGKGEYLYSDAIDKDGNLKESLDLNEGLQFNDSQGTPNKISKEILGYVEKAFPSKLLSSVESVEPNGYDSMSSPVTVTNKGQATGVREYQTITLLFPEGGFGKSKVSSITIGLVKRTSGPGTGYIAIKANHYQGSSSNHILLDKLPNFSVAKEFYDNADGRLKELYNEVLTNHI